MINPVLPFLPSGEDGGNHFSSELSVRFNLLLADDRREGGEVNKVESVICPRCKRRVRIGVNGYIARHGFRRGRQNGSDCPGFAISAKQLIEAYEEAQ
jgi:hypothetical protein